MWYRADGQSQITAGTVRQSPSDQVLPPLRDARQCFRAAVLEGAEPAVGPLAVRWPPTQRIVADMGEALAQLFEMTEPWWLERGVQAEVQLGLVDPIQVTPGQLLGPLVNIIVALTGRLGPGDRLRLAAWQRESQVHILISTHVAYPSIESCGVQPEESAVRSRLAMARAALGRIGGHLYNSRANGSVEVVVPVGPATSCGWASITW
jgi:hypothetical protein